LKVAIIYNHDLTGVINKFGMQNKEVYDPKTVRAVAAALEAGGHNVAIIDGNMHVIEQLQQFMPRVLEGDRMGMVFNMAYGIQGESRYTHIPAMLEMLGIPYVGSSPAGHALALDKVITKIIMQKHGIPTPNFWVFSHPEEDMSMVEFPVIVKPKMEAVSYGLRIANSEGDLREAVKFIVNEFQQQALVEQFIRGREFGIGLLGNNPPEAFPVLEIDLENNPDAIQTVEDKIFNLRNKICPADIPKDTADEMVRLSIDAFNALQLRDFARVDIRLDQNNNIYVLEVNSMASLGAASSYVKAAAVGGYDYNALVNKMLDVAVLRYFADSDLLANTFSKKKKMPLNTRVRAFLRGHQENIEKLLEQAVNLNTYLRSKQRVNEFANLMKKHLIPLGFTVEVFPQVEVGNIFRFSNTDKGEYNVLLLANMDNSTPLSKHEYFQKNEQKLMGTGIWENKGGLIAMIAALQALRFARVLRKLKIGILLTSDDTLQGRFAGPVVLETSRRAKYVIGIQGGSLNSGIVTSRSGAAVYNCQLTLRSPQKAEDVALATSVFSTALHSWSELTDTASGLVIAPREVSIQTNIMQLYAHCEAALSVRFNNVNQMKAVDKKINQAIPSRNRELIHFQIEGGIRRPPMERTEKTMLLAKTVIDIARKLDIRLIEEHRWSSADICFADKNVPAVDGLGPLGNKQHGKSEYILRHSLLERAALLAMVLHELGGDN